MSRLSTYKGGLSDTQCPSLAPATLVLKLPFNRGPLIDPDYLCLLANIPVLFPVTLDSHRSPHFVICIGFETQA